MLLLKCVNVQITDLLQFASDLMLSADYGARACTRWWFVIWASNRKIAQAILPAVILY